MLEFPELPSDYRWFYRPNEWTGQPTVFLQQRKQRFFGGYHWADVESYPAFKEIWGSEQAAIDRATERILKAFEAKQTAAYGAYKENFEL